MTPDPTAPPSLEARARRAYEWALARDGLVRALVVAPCQRSRGRVGSRDNHVSPASWRIRSSFPFKRGAGAGVVPAAFWIASRTIWLSAVA